MVDADFDLFAPVETVEQPSSAKPMDIVRNVEVQEEKELHNQDDACCGCYFMYWGKCLRWVCRNKHHPGVIREKAFCLDPAGNPSHYIPFDGRGSGRLDLDEMCSNNLI